MKKSSLSKLCALIFIFSVFILITNGCSKEDKKAATDKSQGKLKIVTTTGMITNTTEMIGGDLIQVTGLMGPGVDPHLYKASAGDMRRLSEADIIFYNGLHLEGKMAEVFEQMQGRGIKTVAITKDVNPSLLKSPPGFEGAHDPHIWFDISLWITAAQTIKNSLIQLDTKNQTTYEQNAEKYINELKQLHEYVKNQAEKVPAEKRVLITAHDAFNYFGSAYGFEVRGLQGISTASEAGTADVQSLASFIAERKIPAIFVESSVPQRNIEAVQAAVKSRGFDVEIGGELFSDAMGNPNTPEGTYIGMVKHNIDTIVNSLLE
ncbi:manganese transporter [Candidatus Poribacteria bacterium]|nr:manganese transporter [Candidatus Poribacteria bacterium]